MNIKKYLQEQAEKDAENLLDEEDELFIQQLVSDTSEAIIEPKIKKSKRFWSLLASAAVIAVAAIIILPSVFVNRGSHDIFYQDANIISVDCEFEEIKNNTKYFLVDNSSQSLNNFKLNYDSVTNDKLFYTTEGLSLISKYKLYIVINENYDYEFKLNDNLLTQNLSNYILNYCKTGKSGIDDSEVGYSGYIKLQTETIYIEYQQIIDVGEQAFFDDIESIIKVKN